MRDLYVFLYRMFQPIMTGGLLTYSNLEHSIQTDLIYAYIYVYGLTISMLGSLVIFYSVTTKILHNEMMFRIARSATVYRRVHLIKQNWKITSKYIFINL